MLASTSNRFRWHGVLAVSFVAHAAVLCIPLPQHFSGDSATDHGPLLVTLAPAAEPAAASAITPHIPTEAQTAQTAPPPSKTVDSVSLTEPSTASTDSIVDAQPGSRLHAMPQFDPGDLATSDPLAARAPDTGIVLARIRDTIARESYPALARRRGWEGKVQLGFRVEGSGAIDNIHVMHSSGNRVLDESAMRALQRIRYIPAELWLDGYSAELQLPVIYRLSES